MSNTQAQYYKRVDEQLELLKAQGAYISSDERGIRLILAGWEYYLSPYGMLCRHSRNRHGAPQQRQWWDHLGNWRDARSDNIVSIHNNGGN